MIEFRREIPGTAELNYYTDGASVGDAVLPIVGRRELFPDHQGCAKVETYGHEEEPGGAVVKRQGRVQDVVGDQPDGVLGPVAAHQEPALTNKVDRRQALQNPFLRFNSASNLEWLMMAALGRPVVPDV